MKVEERYKNIKNLVKTDFDILEEEIQNLFKDKNPLNEQLSNFITAPAKRLRPLLGLLFLRSLSNKVNLKQYDVLSAVELIHNATLIHDDIIDNAQTRRNRETINTKFDNNLAVIAGDFLLSVAMEKIINTGSIEVFKLCTSSLKSTCMGEINQYFNKFKLTSIDKYIEKSKEKTAFLFKIAVLGSLLVSGQEPDENLKQTASNFAQNFGIAFQIRDDLLNVLNVGNDVASGIYTAPIIFAYEENKNILNEKKVLEKIKTTSAIEKTKDLMDNYFDKAISDVEKLENSIYKQGLLELVELFRTE